MKILENIFFYILLFLCINISFRIFKRIQEGTHQNAFLTEYEIIEKNGYHYEKHFITTQDGYILETIRIFPRRITEFFKNFSSPTQMLTNPRLQANKFGEPVLLTHGFTSYAKVFFLNEPENILAFQLANHGYDVYLASTRGAGGSRRHISLDPDLDAEKFWNFSHHELGLYDQSAVIDFILNKTGFAHLSFVGHSQGATLFFILASMRPEYNDKVKIFFSWAGAATMKYPPNDFSISMAQYEEEYGNFFHSRGIYEHLLGSVRFLNFFVLIDNYIDVKFILKYFLEKMNVLGIHHIKEDLIPVIMWNYPTTQSVKHIVHYMQMIKNRDFRMFDYHDKEKNLEIYGSEIPPAYNLSAVTAKTILYYSDFDEFIREKDTFLMSKIMPNATPRKVMAEKFSHADYLFAFDVNEIINLETMWYLKYLNV